MRFCGTRWLESVPVAERALEIWDKVSKYVTTISSGSKSKVPKIQSFINIQQHVKDPLAQAKLQFFVTIAKILVPFLQKFQTSTPMLPFLGEELHALVRGLMSRFIKKTVLDNATTAAKLCKIEVDDDKNCVEPKKVDVGFAVKALLRAAEKDKKASALQMYSFQVECRLLLRKLTVKLLERCGLKYPIVRHLVAMDPRYIVKQPEDACEQMGKVLEKLMSWKWLTGDECDVTLREFKNLADDMTKYHKQEAERFEPTSDRLDTFYCELCTGKDTFKHIWKVIKMMLTLSHGQSDIERGFSVNSDIATANMKPETLEAYRKVYDGITQRQCNVYEFPITQEMLDSCRRARSRWQTYIDETKKTNANSAAKEKRKMMESDLKTKKSKKQKLEAVHQELMDEADKLSMEAEKKAKCHFL